MSDFAEFVTKLLTKIKNSTGNKRKSYFGMLYDKTAMHLKMIAYKYVNNKADAEDVVSKTLIKALHNIDKFDPSRTQRFQLAL